MAYSVGAATRNFLETISSIVWLIINTGLEMSDRMLGGRLPFRLSLFFEQTDRAVVRSVPLVAMVAVFLGLTMALLTGYQLRRYGTEFLVPALIAIAFTRELGPLITGIVLAARTGAAFTAELGTMVVAEEVEAIEAMGIGPLRYLVAPRLLAVTLLMPCLTTVANMAAIAGASLISRISLNLPFSMFYDTALTNLVIVDILIGILKSFLFGIIIGAISCYKGLGVRGGAAGVGIATTSSVVTAITSVIGFDTFFNIIHVALQE